MANKIATVIANETGQGLTMKVGNRNCFVKVASVEEGGEYTMRLCVDWTYQEFLFEDNTNTGKKLFVNSDDCCDYERIIVKESEGAFVAETVARKEIVSVTEDATHQHTVDTPGDHQKFNWRFWM